MSARNEAEAPPTPMTLEEIDQADRVLSMMDAGTLDEAISPLAFAGVRRLIATARLTLPPRIPETAPDAEYVLDWAWDQVSQFATLLRAAGNFEVAEIKMENAKAIIALRNDLRAASPSASPPTTNEIPAMTGGLSIDAPLRGSVPASGVPTSDRTPCVHCGEPLSAHPRGDDYHSCPKSSGLSTFFESAPVTSGVPTTLAEFDGLIGAVALAQHNFTRAKGSGVQRAEIKYNAAVASLRSRIVSLLEENERLRAELVRRGNA